MNDSLTRPTSDTSPTVHHIFTLKSSTPIYAINRGKRLWPDALPDANRYEDGAQYFYWDIIYRGFPTKSEERFSCPLDGDCILPGIKLLFQKASGLIKTQILFNPPVIKTQILSLGRLDPLTEWGTEVYKSTLSFFSSTISVAFYS